MDFSMMAAPYLVIVLVILILIALLYFIYKAHLRITERKPEKVKVKKKRDKQQLPLRDSKGRFKKRPF